jgi:DME family drug/metabolite transporter
LASFGSVMLMGERLGAGAWVGALLVAGAVVLVADSDGPLHRDRQGLALGLMAVLCGLSGAFLARQVLISSDLTPLQTAAVRLLGGWLALLPLVRARGSRRSVQSSPTLRIVLATALGTNLGIALQQLVFQTMPVGPGVTLMSTAPVMALLAGRFEGDPIQPRGVLAAVLAVAGVACSV